MADHMTTEQMRASLIELAQYARIRKTMADVDMRSAAHGFVSLANSIEQLAARVSGMAAAPRWRLIETAPKDRRVELWIPGFFSNPGRATHGEWEPQKLHTRPRPFWRFDLFNRESDMRDQQPTHWREPSAAPEPPHV